jgi:hypothetical protein
MTWWLGGGRGVRNYFFHKPLVIQTLKNYLWKIFAQVPEKIKGIDANRAYCHQSSRTATKRQGKP